MTNTLAAGVGRGWGDKLGFPSGAIWYVWRVRLYLVAVVLCLVGGTARAQSPAPAANPPGAPVAPRALPVNPADLKSPDAPIAVPNGVNVHWYGHGFIYLTSSVGIRAAIDPFGPETVHYPFPQHLAADFVLVTHEAEDHCAADLIFGNPLIFRSVMAVGLNRANGIPFYGVALQKDQSIRAQSNTAYTLSFDGIKFGYLGQIIAPLNAQEKQQLGQVDVLFLPVGLTTLSVSEMNDVVKDMSAKMVIPINYKTDESGILELRGLDDYLAGTKFPVRRISSDEIVVSRDTVPSQPTIYALKSP
jgi:L-ascorbate metabolism protein UlaG (beta-lactamase superfamily)